jgi:hypothetical protein
VVIAEPNRSAHKVDSEMAALAWPLSTSANKDNDTDDDGDAGGAKATILVPLLLPGMVTNAVVISHCSSSNKHGKKCIPEVHLFPLIGFAIFKSTVTVRLDSRKQLLVVC